LLVEELCVGVIVPYKIVEVEVVVVAVAIVVAIVVVV
jgi:hypothetical protein